MIYNLIWRFITIFLCQEIIDGNFNCRKLFLKNNKRGIEAAIKWKEYLLSYRYNIDLKMKSEQGCELSSPLMKYYEHPPRIFEENFPLAFSIIITEGLFQFERLFRAIYRPWNYYCINIVKTHDKMFRDLIFKIINCLNSKGGSIILLNTSTELDYKDLFEADLNCMKALKRKTGNWKYFFNLRGFEFPLKTNKQLVKILMSYKGANNIDGTSSQIISKYIPTKSPLFPITWFIGSSYITASRKFVEHILSNIRTRMLLEIVKTSKRPDLVYFPTINFNIHLQAPGSFVGDPDDIEENGPDPQFNLTMYERCPLLSDANCRNLLGVRDLPRLGEAPHLFAGPFSALHEPAALRCLERNYHQYKIWWDTLEHTRKFNISRYSSLSFVIYQYRP